MLQRLHSNIPPDASFCISTERHGMLSILNTRVVIGIRIWAPQTTDFLTGFRLATLKTTRWQVEIASRYSLFQAESFNHVFSY